MHCVAGKSAEHQARVVTFRTHQCLVRQRTQLINALRNLAEFGLVFPEGPAHLKQAATLLGADGTTDVPGTVREIATIESKSGNASALVTKNLNRSLNRSRVGEGPCSSGGDRVDQSEELQNFNRVGIRNIDYILVFHRKILSQKISRWITVIYTKYYGIFSFGFCIECNAHF